jgi:transcriptional regulator with XRE-family HTH domain
LARRKTVPDIIGQLREAVSGSGLSLSEIARRAGLSEGQLSRFMRSERTLTLPAAAKVCTVLGLQLVKPDGAVGGPVGPATTEAAG